MNKALWSSAYRTMFLPYRLEKISFIPEVAMDVLFKSKYNYLMLIFVDILLNIKREQKLI